MLAIITTGAIYEIVHSDSGRRYVGQSKQVATRWRRHLSSSRAQLKKQHIHHAIALYGEASFEFNVLWSGECSQIELDSFERFQIAFWQTKIRGFNETDGGGGCVGFKMPVKAVQKVVAANTGKIRTPEQRARISASRKGRPNGHLGMKRSDESRRKMSESHRNISDETRRKMSEAAKLRCLKRSMKHV